MSKINQLSILMHLLSKEYKDSNKIGVTKKEALEYLNVPSRNSDLFFQELLTHLAKYIQPIGLQIRFNPINEHWYLSYDDNISDLIQANPFSDKPRLPATLFCILTVAMRHTGEIRAKNVKELRKKKGIHRDLRDLEDLGYISLEKDNNGMELIKLTPLIGYQLDLEKLSLNLALHTKKKKEEGTQN
ncbi:MAG: hypothetical protein R6U96_15200 [Promethearchaeia archaeon]